MVLGAARYDLEAGKFDQTRVGLGYIDDCFMMSLNYITDYSYSGNAETNHTVMLQMSLRTLGGSAVGKFAQLAASGRAATCGRSGDTRPTAACPERGTSEHAGRN